MVTSDFLRRLVFTFILSLSVIALLIYACFKKLQFSLGIRREIRGASEIPSYPEIKTRKIINPCLITRFYASHDRSPVAFQLNVSSLWGSLCYILSDIPIEEFHRLLVEDHNLLTNFCEERSILTLPVCSGNKELAFEVGKPSPPRNSAGKTTDYPIIITLKSDSVGFGEQIIISCYVVHFGVKVGQHETTILHTFWKTNWNRLLTPQVLYAARVDYEEMEANKLIFPNSSGCAPWKPSCFVCLSSVENGLHVFLPCRHAGLCSNCFRLFNRRKYPVSPTDLCCPICRSLVVCSLRLPLEDDTK